MWLQTYKSRCQKMLHAGIWQIGVHNCINCNSGGNEEVVLIQGLQESGMFKSVIASAPTTLSKQKFLSAIEKSNSSRAVASESLLSRKIGRIKIIQSTVRKILDTESLAFQEAALPPLSPPGSNRAHFTAEAY